MKPVPTRTFEHHQHQVAATAPGRTVRKAGLGELAIQEVMNGFALATPPTQGVFLFEDHKIARVGFLLPESCQKGSTRAFLIFLEGSGLIASAREIESRAIQARPGFFSAAISTDSRRKPVTVSCANVTCLAGFHRR